MSKAQNILDAVQLAANKDIEPLQRQFQSSNLKPALFLRIILTFLPESTDPEAYIPLLRCVTDGPAQSPTVRKVHDRILDSEARRKVRQLRLLPLAHPGTSFGDETDLLSLFLVHRAHRIEADAGSLEFIRRLLQPFVCQSGALRTWMISNLLPLIRLEYGQRAQAATTMSLDDIERIEGSAAIQLLIPSGHPPATTQEEPDVMVQDLRGVVTPWMYGEHARKRRKLEHESVTDSEKATSISKESDWSYVNDWIVDLASHDFFKATEVLTNWQGPADADYGEWVEDSRPMDGDENRHSMEFAQACLASFYANHDKSDNSVDTARRVLQRVIDIGHLEAPADLTKDNTLAGDTMVPAYIGKISQAHLLRNALLRTDNPLTQVSKLAITLANIFLASSTRLHDLYIRKPIKDVVELMLFTTDEEQMAELERLLQRTKNRNLSESAWDTYRQKILWLKDCQGSVGPHELDPLGVFSKIPIAELENNILRAILDSGCYSLATNVYCKKDAPLPSATVKETVIDAVLSAYDAASNGNWMRGGVKKASDIIMHFRGYYPSSKRFTQIGALLSATHSMSFYSLTLQRGVPFQPVNIRAHKDPMSLIGKILDQNSRSYTHLDDLLEIGQNLVAAGLGMPASRFRDDDQIQPGSDHDKLIARRRVIRMAIEAALAEDDFDTAYSYVVNRLSTVTKPDVTSEQTPLLYDDISWRAAYATGSYATSNTGTSAIRRIEQRMELLSQALLLAPPSALAELLGVWQQTEQHMVELLAREAAEEKQAEKEQTGIIPGGFNDDPSPVASKPRDSSRSAMLEEAPMGLFEVARGAASALSKNAFPLRGGAKTGAGSNDEKPRAYGEGESSEEFLDAMEGQSRVRKRDMLTQGLASGIGWVIGAPPAQQQ